MIVFSVVCCDADKGCDGQIVSGGEVESLYPFGGDLSELQLFMTMSWFIGTGNMLTTGGKVFDTEMQRWSW